jgi:outer membrane lipoprotein-sorting protein
MNRKESTAMNRIQLKKGFAVTLTVMLIGVGVTASAAAQKITDFSADQVVIGVKGKVEQESKLSVAGDRVRIDKVVPADAKMSFIYSRDQKKAVTTNPGKKIYFEGPLDEKAFAAALGLPPAATAERSAGEETVSGIPCAKKDLDMEIEFKKAKKTVTNTVWVSDKLDIPLRVKSYDGRVTELRNVKEGKPDPALFEAPKDFKKAASLKDVLPSDPFLDDED